MCGPTAVSAAAGAADEPAEFDPLRRNTCGTMTSPVLQQFSAPGTARP
jgi:hypothetical protein